MSNIGNARKLEVNLEKLHSLEVKTYDHGNVVDHGLISREVYGVMPELACLDKDGNPVGVKHMTLIMLLLAEVQRLKRMVDELD